MKTLRDEIIEDDARYERAFHRAKRARTRCALRAMLGEPGDPPDWEDSNRE